MLTFQEIMNSSPKNQENFNELLKLCKAQLIVPYIGAGLSIDFGYPSWVDALKTLAKNCEPEYTHEITNNDNLLKVADEIMNRLTQSKFNEKFKEVFSNNIEVLKKDFIGLKPADFYIKDLFKGVILTTNFDKILETIDDTLEVAFYTDIEKIQEAKNNKKHLLYKIHGCVSNPFDVVFTEGQYNKVYGRSSALVKSLSDFFNGTHLLFLGSSFGITKDEKAFELWQELISNGMEHFSIVDYKDCKDLEKKQKYFKNINIHPIFYYANKDFIEGYDAVKIILKAILEQTKDSFSKIPKYTTTFVGREEILEKIEKHFENTNIATFAITGTGGVGKTRIMDEYANTHPHKQDYNNNIVWFIASSKSGLQEEIRKFVVEKEKITEDVKDEKEINNAVKSWMKENDNFLFCLDNVEHYEDIKFLLKLVEDINTKDKKHFLITTQRPDLPVDNIKVDVFSQEEAQKFLSTHTDLKSNDFSKKIADELGNLPLALELASSYIKENQYTYEAYFNELEKEHLSLLRQGKTESATLSVATTWNITMGKIDSNETKDILNLCSFFAPDNIPCSWFSDASELLPQNLQKKVKNEDEYQKIKDELTKYSLVRISEDNKISMHRLLQEVIRNSLADNTTRKLADSINYDALEVCINIMDRLIFYDFSNFESRNRFRKIILHIKSLFEHNKIHKKESREIASLYHFFMFGYYQLENYQEALNYKDNTLEIVRIKSELHNIANTYLLIGAIYKGMNDKAMALKYYHKVSSMLEMPYKEIEKQDIEEKKKENIAMPLAGSYNNIANFYSGIGKFNHALKYYKKALKIKEQYSSNLAISTTADTYNSLGNCYRCLANKNIYHRVIFLSIIYGGIVKSNRNKAMFCYDKALSTIENYPASTKRADIYRNIGIIYHDGSNYHEALFYLRTALIIRKEAYKEELEHSDLSQIYNDFAKIYIDIGCYKRAYILLKHILIIDRKNKFSDTTIYYNIAMYYYNQNKYNKSLVWFKKVFLIWKNDLGEKHSSVKYLKKIMKNAYNYNIFDIIAGFFIQHLNQFCFGVIVLRIYLFFP
jgi:tetratricopeptide (TPR) repeat protein